MIHVYLHEQLVMGQDLQVLSQFTLSVLATELN